MMFMGMEHSECKKLDAFVKTTSPRRVGILGTVLRFIFRHSGVAISTPLADTALWR